MICLIRNDQNEKLCMLSAGSHTIDFEGVDLYLEVNEPRHIYVNQYQISYYNEDIGFACFKKYKLQHEITIGTHEMSQIQIKDTNVLCINSIIHVNDMKILNKGVNKVFVNSRYREHYESFDLLSINQIKIVVTPLFIMINHPQCIRVNLEAYSDKKRSKALNLNYPVLSKKQRKSCVNPGMEIQFIQFEQITKTDKHPLFFTMFPILVMSFASLVAGLFMAYQGYMQGREIYEIAPSLLLPFVMLMSGLLVHPMQRIYENKRNAKKLKQRESQISNYLIDVGNEIKDFECQITNYESMCYFSIDSYSKALKLKEAVFMSKQNTNSDFLRIPLGKGIIDSLITYKNVPEKRDAYYYRSVHQLMEQHKHFANHWHILDLNQATSIYTNVDVVIEWILFNLVSQYDHNFVHVIIIASYKWFEEHYFLCFLPHVRLSDELCLYTSNQSYKTSLSKESTRKRIVFNLSNEHIEKNNSDVVISLIDNEVIPIDSDYFITCVNQQMTVVMNNKSESRCVFNENNETIKKCLRELSMYIACNQYCYPHPSMVTTMNSTVRSFEGIEKNWCENKSFHSLRVCVGWNTYGHDYFLDLSERVHGPHMLIASTTGGGKTEALITILISLASSYSSELVQFVLVDFKGGGLAQSLKEKNIELPHLIGSISNLDEHEVERFFYSLSKESKRRQSLFNIASQDSGITSMDIDKYQRYADQVGIDQIAHLFVVVDEFAELKTSYPDYMVELVSCSRIGRSLGIHLILSTQKPANVVDAQIWSNCRTKICLKVQDKQDSLEMIGKDDAYYLKKPGEFIQLTDNELYRGTFHYMNAKMTQENEFKMHVMDFNWVHKEMQSSETSNTVLYETIKNILKIPVNKKRALWCNPLDEIGSKICKEHRNSIGMIDDIANSEQYPLVINKESHILCMSKTKEGISKIVTTYLYSTTLSFEGNFELFIMDESEQFRNFVSHSNFTHLVNTDELIGNLIQLIQDRVKTDIHLQLIVLNAVTFLEKCNALDVDIRKFLNLGMQFNYSLFLCGLVSNAIPYSCWNYFETKIAFEVTNTQELSTLFERTIKPKSIQNNCGYVMNDKLHLFKLAIVTMNELEFVQNTITHTKMKLNQMPVFITSNRKGDLGISYVTYTMMNLANHPFVIFISKYKYKFEEFLCLMNCSRYRLTDEASIFGTTEGIVFGDEVDVSDLQQLKTHLEAPQNSFILCIESSKWDVSWVKKMGEDSAIYWIGEGFREQYILSNTERLDCTNQEGIYCNKGRKEKFRLINEYNGNRD